MCECACVYVCVHSGWTGRDWRKLVFESGRHKKAHESMVQRGDVDKEIRLKCEEQETLIVIFKRLNC